MAAPCGGLVDGNLGDIRGVASRAPLGDVVVNHAPQPGVVSPAIRATALTGMAEIMVISSASNSRVKPLSGHAHGTLTVLMLKFKRRIERGILQDARRPEGRKLAQHSPQSQRQCVNENQPSA